MGWGPRRRRQGRARQEGGPPRRGLPRAGLPAAGLARPRPSRHQTWPCRRGAPIRPQACRQDQALAGRSPVAMRTAKRCRKQRGCRMRWSRSRPWAGWGCVVATRPAAAQNC